MRRSLRLCRRRTLAQGQLRIISGEFGGRVLGFPLVGGVRPTSGRTREALFSALQSRISFENLQVLDLFSGSGGLGLEALSRGAQKVTFVEREKKLVVALKKNLEILGAENRALVIESDVFRWIKGDSKKTFDIIFADPPYGDGNSSELPSLIAQGVLRSGGLFILECGKREVVPIPEMNYEVVLERSSGDTKYYLLRAK